MEFAQLFSSVRYPLTIACGVKRIQHLANVHPQLRVYLTNAQTDWPRKGQQLSPVTQTARSWKNADGCTSRSSHPTELQALTGLLMFNKNHNRADISRSTSAATTIAILLLFLRSVTDYPQLSRHGISSRLRITRREPESDVTAIIAFLERRLFAGDVVNPACQKHWMRR